MRHDTGMRLGFPEASAAALGSWAAAVEGAEHFKCEGTSLCTTQPLPLSAICGCNLLGELSV
jgi:hypothetical protein